MLRKKKTLCEIFCPILEFVSKLNPMLMVDFKPHNSTDWGLIVKSWIFNLFCHNVWLKHCAKGIAMTQITHAKCMRDSTYLLSLKLRKSSFIKRKEFNS